MFIKDGLHLSGKGAAVFANEQIEKWLTDRRQHVVVDREVSNWKSVLSTTIKEKDLGVTITADVKVSEQCGIAASKGNQILWLIRRNIT